MTTVTVYTKDRCEQCKATERKLTERGIPFDTDDATEPGNTAAIKALGFLSAPVVVAEVDGQTAMWSGYRPDLIDQLAARIGADQ